MKKALIGLLVVVALVAIGLMVWEPLLAESAEAPPKRAYDVEIVRDTFGTPHIYGKTDADAAYGLAYAHAEDDFTTLQEVVAMTRGRAGAMLGAEGAQIDFVYHLLEPAKDARARYPALPADVRVVLEGYASGLNRYAEKHPGEVRLGGLFPVGGQDIAAGFVLRAPFFFGLDSVLGALAEDKPPPVESAAPMTPVGRSPEQNGSNAFAVAPSRMADGQPWLISNSHQPYEGSVAWYEAIVHSQEGLHMAGALFPGSPFVLLGHNRDLAWTNTVNRPDLIDVYKLVLDASGERYRYDGKWLPLESKRAWLRVKFGPFTLPVPRTVHRSVHGPVIVNKNGAFAVRYPGMSEVKLIEQYYRLQKARGWEEWTQAMRIGGIGATNFLYADKTGKIAFIYNALFPARKPGFDYTGVLPGDTSAAVWSGSLGFDAMPKIVDPPSGFVTNANNAPFLSAGPGSELDPSAFSPLMGIERRVTNRGIRGVELMAANPAITPEALLAIKFDTAYSKASYAGRWMTALLAADLRDAPDLKRAQDLLRTWDYTSDGKGGADTLAEILMREGNRANYNAKSLPDARAELQIAVDHLVKHFGRIDPPLLAVQRLQRGSVDLPMDGGTDTLRATSRWEKMPDGRGRVRHGDSFTMLVTWNKAGQVQSRSIQPYGAATTRPDSPHYTDQMKLFVAKKFKPVWFTPAQLNGNIERRYRP